MSFPVCMSGGKCLQESTMQIRISSAEAESVSESFRYYGFQLLRDSDEKFRNIDTMDLCFRISSALSGPGVKGGDVIIEIPDEQSDVISGVISRYIFIEAEDGVGGDERWLSAMMSVYRQAAGIRPLKVKIVKPKQAKKHEKKEDENVERDAETEMKMTSRPVPEEETVEVEEIEEEEEELF